ncbi:hypothetical protein R0J90_03990 [Micrococcus sp. SIMBA_144]
MVAGTAARAVERVMMTTIRRGRRRSGASGRADAAAPVYSGEEQTHSPGDAPGSASRARTGSSARSPPRSTPPHENQEAP